MWNARPVNPVFGTATIRPGNDYYFPFINDGAWSGQCFYADASHGPMNVYPNSSDGRCPTDEARDRVITIPHWPPNTVSSPDGDAYAMVYDSTTDIWHTFNGLAYSNGQWNCYKYCPNYNTSTGWGSPQEPDFGPMAVGAGRAGGLLRAADRNYSTIPHALQLFGPKDGPGIFTPLQLPKYPATEEDWWGYWDNSGTAGNSFRYGALLMLPPSFNAEAMSNEPMRAVARCLKTYGCYLVDRTGSGIVIGADIGSNWNQYGNQHDMELVRDALREVISCDGWLDALGYPFTPPAWADMNLLSMRNLPVGGALNGQFNTVTDYYETPATTAAGTVTSGTYFEPETVPSGNTFEPWWQWSLGAWYTVPTQGRSYKLTAYGYGSITGNIEVRAANNTTILYSSPYIAPGQSATFTWPTGTGLNTYLHVSKPANAPASGIRLELIGADVVPLP